jgi:hypothetical protein
VLIVKVTGSCPGAAVGAAVPSLGAALAAEGLLVAVELPPLHADKTKVRISTAIRSELRLAFLFFMIRKPSLN